MKAPNSGKNRILQTLENEKLNSNILNAEQTKFTQFADISEYSNVKSWQNIASQITPPEDFDIYSHLLYKDREKLLSVVWINDFLPAEIHYDKLESFFVLEGSCTCHLGEESIKMEAGSYLQIPLNVVHDLKVTSSEPLKVILTKKKVA